MKLIVFSGPTVDVSTVRSFLDAEVRGPASFGDVYRAAECRPQAIAIIDGYFDRVPAVWHKEILWAMSQGIHVFGAASMGALRAAELSEFGMFGIGEVFRAYQAGELEDDDEVAVAHGDAEACFVTSSEAMVNIRATLRHASASGILTTESSATLVRLAKARFYAERSFATLLHDAAAAGVPPDVLATLRGWLPLGRVDIKRADAVELMAHLRAFCSEPYRPKRVSYRFNATDAWHQATRIASRDQSADDSPVDLADVVEELKLAGSYGAAWHAAAVRGAAVEEAARAGIRPDFAATRSATEQLRTGLGLADLESVARWRAEQHLSEAQALVFLEDQARLAWGTPLFDELARRHLVDHLRSLGQYGEVRARAAAKKPLSRIASSPAAELRRLSLSEAGLWEWYFLKKLGRPVPADLAVYARHAGFRDTEELRVAVIRDLAYERSRG